MVTTVNVIGTRPDDARYARHASIEHATSNDAEV